jgi:hypothetical protein
MTEDQELLFNEIISNSPQIQTSMELARVHLFHALEMLNKVAIEHDTIFTDIMISVQADMRTDYLHKH